MAAFVLLLVLVVVLVWVKTRGSDSEIPETKGVNTTPPETETWYTTDPDPSLFIDPRLSTDPWHEYVDLTPQSQGSCGACTYFAVASMMSDCYNLRYKPVVKVRFSPQSLLDASEPYRYLTGRSVATWSKCEGNVPELVLEAARDVGAARMSECGRAVWDSLYTLWSVSYGHQDNDYRAFFASLTDAAPYGRHVYELLCDDFETEIPGDCAYGHYTSQPSNCPYIRHNGDMVRNCYFEDPETYLSNAQQCELTRICRAEFTRDETTALHMLRHRGTIIAEMYITTYFLENADKDIILDNSQVAGEDTVVSGHVACIVGHGEEGGIPFWIFRNSHGPTNHRNGFFRVRRGVNAFSLGASDSPQHEALSFFSVQFGEDRCSSIEEYMSPPTTRHPSRKRVGVKKLPRQLLPAYLPSS